MSCPLWVIGGRTDKSAPCPLYPQKWTFVSALSTSALCQEQTLSQ
jgi:hypothetical protein